MAKYWTVLCSFDHYWKLHLLINGKWNDFKMKSHSKEKYSSGLHQLQKRKHSTHLLNHPGANNIPFLWESWRTSESKILLITKDAKDHLHAPSMHRQLLSSKNIVFTIFFDARIFSFIEYVLFPPTVCDGRGSSVCEKCEYLALHKMQYVELRKIFPCILSNINFRYIYIFI